jgi:hypothetical protein
VQRVEEGRGGVLILGAGFGFALVPGEGLGASALVQVEGPPFEAVGAGRGANSMLLI